MKTQHALYQGKFTPPHFLYLSKVSEGISQSYSIYGNFLQKKLLPGFIFFTLSWFFIFNQPLIAQMRDGSNCGKAIMVPTPQDFCQNTPSKFNGKELWMEFINNSPELAIEIKTPKDYLTEKISRISLYEGCPILTKVAEKKFNDGTSPRLEVTNLKSNQIYYLKAEREIPPIGKPLMEIDFSICLQKSIVNVNVVNHQSDCNTAESLTCSSTNSRSVTNMEAGFGANEVDNINSCFNADGEHQSMWYSFTFSQSGTFTFTIVPADLNDDFDFALFDITSPNDCNNMGNAIRCSWAGLTGNTGIGFIATDVSEGSGGDGWVSFLNVSAGQTYALLIDNFDESGIGFNLTFGGTAAFPGGLPSAQFTMSPNPVCIDFTADFTNQSTNATSYLWDFGDGSATSTDASPTYSYATAGTFTVTLTAINNCGANTITKTISVVSPPTALFTMSPNPVCVNSTVNFTSQSTNAYHYYWAFGDGTFYNNINPNTTHTYVTPGTYTVTLVVYGYCGTIWSLISSQIIVNTSVISLNTYYATICVGESVTLTASGGTYYLWSTGATTASITISPSSTTLYIVSDINGCGIATAVVSIPVLNINPPSSTKIACSFQSITLTASGGTGSYIWNNGATTNSITVSPTTTSYYNVYDGCSAPATAIITVDFSSSSDLWMQDTPEDNGVEPNGLATGISEDIWNRVSNDWGSAHEEPDYSANNNPNYLLVKVRNRGSEASSGCEMLFVYWTIANIASSWPTFWENYVVNGIISGKNITPSGVFIPVIAAGGSTIVKIPWYPPNPADFGLTELGVCLLARIITEPFSPSFGMTYPEGSEIVYNVRYNNNIIMKNVDVVDNTGNIVVQTGDVYCDKALSYNFLFNVASEEINKPFTANGLVNIDLGKAIYDKWVKGGRKGSGFEVGKFNHMSANGILHHHSLQHFPYTTSPYSISITENPEAILENIQYEPCELLPIQVSFNYFPQPTGVEKKVFNYDIIQTKTDDNSEMGRVRFNIHRPDCVTPIAGVDQTIGRGCKTNLTASPIENDATYTWYDNATGSFIAQGSSMEVSPENTTTYELQIISENGCIAYDLLTVNVDLDNNSIACIPAPDAWGCFREEKIEPNPAGGNDLHVKFIAEERGNINISLANTMGRVLKSDNLKVEQGPVDHVLSLRAVPIGVYRIIIKCKEKVREILVTRL